MGEYTITVQGNGAVKIITVTKCLGGEVRRLEVLLCYDYQNGITDEKDTIFATKPKLFSIGIINLPETMQFLKITNVIMDTSVKTSNLKLKLGV